VENRKIVKYTIDEIKEAYVDIYKSVFDDYDYEGNCPSIVYVCFENDEFVGFLSGYIQSQNTWYLQRGGFTKSEQGRFLNLARYRAGIDEIHKEWLGIMTLIKNTDISALKLSLGLNFRIIGTRMDTGNNLWVELLHIRGD